MEEEKQAMPVAVEQTPSAQLGSINQNQAPIEATSNGRRKKMIWGIIIGIIVLGIMLAISLFLSSVKRLGTRDAVSDIQVIGYTQYTQKVRESLIAGDAEWLVSNIYPVLKEKYGQATVEKLVAGLVSYFSGFSGYSGNFNITEPPTDESQMFEEASQFTTEDGRMKKVYITTIRQSGKDYWVIIQPDAANYDEATSLSQESWAAAAGE